MCPLVSPPGTNPGRSWGSTLERLNFSPLRSSTTSLFHSPQTCGALASSRICCEFMTHMHAQAGHARVVIQPAFALRAAGSAASLRSWATTTTRRSTTSWPASGTLRWTSSPTSRTKPKTSSPVCWWRARAGGWAPQSRSNTPGCPTRVSTVDSVKRLLSKLQSSTVAEDTQPVVVTSVHFFQLPLAI